MWVGEEERANTKWSICKVYPSHTIKLYDSIIDWILGQPDLGFESRLCDLRQNDLTTVSFRLLIGQAYWKDYYVLCSITHIMIGRDGLMMGIWVERNVVLTLAL